MLNSMKSFFKLWPTPPTKQHDTVNQTPSANTDNTAASVTANCDAVKTIKGFKFTFRVVYLLLIVSFVLHVFPLHTFVRQSADTSVFEAFLKSDVASHEVEVIVQNYLNRIKSYAQDGSAATTTLPPPVEEDLDDNHVKSEYEYSWPYNENQNVRNERKSDHHRTRRETNRVVKMNYLSSLAAQSDAMGPEVEFFNPKLRHELEKKDAELIKKTGAKGAAPNGDQWVWLTSYSRIPYEAITGFCKATKEYCPPGPAGLPGVPGPKGNRGDSGLPGPSGLDGREGKTGPRGPKGEIGYPGNPGLDGRDGVPGEPGLDGVPGRAGADGIPGKDGKDGIPGIDGRDGKDGKDGLTGPVGPPGATGPPGEKGLHGPRGRSGKPGTNGVPGIPGVGVFKAKSNGSDVILIPPSIAGVDTMKPIIINEGKHLRLRCGATGQPKPQIQWRRDDGRPIAVGAFMDSSVPGQELNITKINRVHMGAYHCLADNGIPPPVQQIFHVEVHFPPLINVRQQKIYAYNGSSAYFDCEEEAFPEALKYWERAPDGRLLEPGPKYIIETIINGYKSKMRLTITKIKPSDYGEYHCISKNELGIARATFQLLNRDPDIIQPFPDSTAITTYGASPPPLLSMEDICGPVITCPECPSPKDFKCKDAITSLADLIIDKWNIAPTDNANYPGFPNRTLDCHLYAVGKPVYHKFSEQTYGAWMKDALPRQETLAEKIWVTSENEPQRLYEYIGKDDYRTNKHKKVHRLDRAFRGNAHVVYNGSFYYCERDSPKIVKYDFSIDRIERTKELPGLKPTTKANDTNYLYSTGYNVMDFNVDDNGLWVIYAVPFSNYTFVAKVDAVTLEVQVSWNISIHHHKVGEMFIVCGVLYAIDSVTARDTKIRLRVDLYRKELLDDAGLSFTNPFRKTTTVGYNHRNKELYTWDKGNQLTYPIRYNEAGYNSVSAEKSDDTNSQVQTGYDFLKDNGEIVDNVDEIN